MKRRSNPHSHSTFFKTKNNNKKQKQKSNSPEREKNKNYSKENKYQQQKTSVIELSQKGLNQVEISISPRLTQTMGSNNLLEQ